MGGVALAEIKLSLRLPVHAQRPAACLEALRFFPPFALDACLPERAEFTVFPDGPAAADLLAIQKDAGYPPCVDVAESVGLDHPPYAGEIRGDRLFLRLLRAAGWGVGDSVIAVAGLLAAAPAQLPTRVLTLPAAPAKTLRHVLPAPERPFGVLPPALHLL